MRQPAPRLSEQEGEQAEETEEPSRPRRASLSLQDRALVCVKESPGVGIVLDTSSAQAKQALQGLMEQGKLCLKDDLYYLASQ